MSMLGLTTVQEYVAYVQEHSEEIERILDVLTIHVTEFFRDSAVFETLAQRVFPWIIDKKLSENSRTIRIWSAGCATGEEAYSIAMHLMDRLRREKADCGIQIFGTDISEESCRIAKRCLYTEKRLSDVPRRFRKWFFEAAEGGYTVSPEIRRCVKFEVHDLFTAPPFSKLDLIFCRNVLIHFDQNARNRVIFNFHSALGEDGILVLGKSEAVAGAGHEMFELMDPKNKIYRKTARCACDKEA